MTDEATIKVNEFTPDEQARIANETAKPNELEQYCLSPDQYRRAINRALSLTGSLACCTHQKSVYVGAITYCTTCGAIKRPKPTPRDGVPIADTDWIRPMWVEELRRLTW